MRGLLSFLVPCVVQGFFSMFSFQKGCVCSPMKHLHLFFFKFCFSLFSRGCYLRSGLIRQTFFFFTIFLITSLHVKQKLPHASYPKKFSPNPANVMYTVYIKIGDKRDKKKLISSFSLVIYPKIFTL